jgi:hypothetical protein
VVTHGTYNLEVKSIDSTSTIDRLRHDFIAYDFDVPRVSMILGFPWLQDVDLAI